jgi:riboflavin kinase / FMN adenylyltransferase
MKSFPITECLADEGSLLSQSDGCSSVRGMQLARSLDNIPDETRGAVVVIGNFDGVHLGHASLIQAARIKERPLAVLTFEPHPRSVFYSHAPTFRLTPFTNKTHCLAALGVDLCVTLNFDRVLAAMAPERFVREVLLDGLGASQVVVGYDFSFGSDRTGNASLLRRLGTLHGFSVTEAAAVLDEGGQPYSSTRIRRHLLDGEPRLAARLLGRPWTVEGRMNNAACTDLDSKRFGASMDCGDFLQPASGVYSVQVSNGAGGRVAATAIVAPPRNSERSWLRLHLPDHNHDVTGEHCAVEFMDMLKQDLVDIDSIRR